MDVEQRLQAIERKLYKAQMVAGMALGLAMVLSVLALVQLASN